METLTLHYTSTVDEAVEVHLRLLELTGGLRRQYWQMGAVLLLAAAGMYFFLRGTPSGRLFFCLLFLAIGALLLRFAWIPMLKREVRKTLVKGLGTDRPFECEYTADERGISCRMLGNGVSFEWGIIRTMLETDQHLELITHPAGLMRLPKRAFQGETLEAWKRAVRERANLGAADRP